MTCSIKVCNTTRKRCARSGGLLAIIHSTWVANDVADSSPEELMFDFESGSILTNRLTVASSASSTVNGASSSPESSTNVASKTRSIRIGRSMHTVPLYV